MAFLSIRNSSCAPPWNWRGTRLPNQMNCARRFPKKKKEEIEKHRDKFVEGAVEKGMEQSTAEAIYRDWEEFARYGFNKSHAADYGVIAVQTAYLKSHYPAEYMAALLSASAGQTEKVAFYVADARSMGVPVLAPDVNASEWDFEIEDVEVEMANPTSALAWARSRTSVRARWKLIIEARKQKASSPT